MKNNNQDMRLRNPFHNPLVTELIEDPALYGKMFSERILVGETLAAFRPTNTVLTGPQGSGKSMILNLIRYRVLSDWLKKQGKPPLPLTRLEPFMGISINLVRASFHAFGRRSISRARHLKEVDFMLEAICAGDYLNHYLLREYLLAMKLLASSEGTALRTWLGIAAQAVRRDEVARDISDWPCWFGYYSAATNFVDMLERCERRLNAWLGFLCANTDDVPEEIWATKTMLGEPEHQLGNHLRSLGSRSRRPNLFVVIDQFEVLRELNPTHGTTLLQAVNVLIKARDPVVFYKIGARTYDWGTELRVLGAESRIEVQRDYVHVDLAKILMRNEDGSGWLFPDFCKDVSVRRLRTEGKFAKAGMEAIQKMLGPWSAEDEATYYKKSIKNLSALHRGLGERLSRRLVAACGPNPSALELRLAGAWALQKIQGGWTDRDVVRSLGERPWQRESWRKERVAVALVQLASAANERLRYFGWDTMLYLSGANISAFLLICSKIWDVAAKVGVDPLGASPVGPQEQSEGVRQASEEWFERDRNDNTGGRRRHAMVGRIGQAIHDALVVDPAISNPGHTGFSLRESELTESDDGLKVLGFLQDAVSWTILEERQHTSKQREGATRRKWYLHPLLSPRFGIPFKRVKEPRYVGARQVYEWLVGTTPISFGPRRGAKLVSPRNRTLTLFDE